MTDAPTAPPLFVFSDLLRHVCPDWSVDAKWKVVRHLDNRPLVPDLLELFHLDREALEFYQADQTKDVFNCEGVFSFLGLPNRRALFVGGYIVRGRRETVVPDARNTPAALREMFAAQAAESPGERHYFYDLQRDPRFTALEMRVVIDWGAGGLAWHQWALDKPVVELRDPNSLGDCPDHLEVDVTLAKLKFLMEHEDANASWRDRLSSVGGIYLLTDHANHALYVGQAGGETGIWGRWRHYAEQRTSNVAVDDAFASGTLRPESCSLSVLEVLPVRAASKPLLDRLEARWKRRLCSRGGGYNRN